MNFIIFMPENLAVLTKGHIVFVFLLPGNLTVTTKGHIVFLHFIFTI
jgi:hypothetical protein